MQRGPAGVAIGRASCPLCHVPMVVSTNKHGFPGAYCTACLTQFQPRDETGALLLMGRISEWTNPDAARAMLVAGDVPNLASKAQPIAPRLPPHLTQSTPAPAKPAKAAPWWDKPLA